MTFLIILIVILSFENLTGQHLNSGSQSLSFRDFGMSYSIGSLNVAPIKNNELKIIPGVMHTNTIIKKKIPYQENEVKVDFFPNPAKDVIYIEAHSKNIKKLEYKIIDITGKEYFQGIIEKRIRLNISNIPNQIYYFQIEKHNRIIDRKNFLKIK